LVLKIFFFAKKHSFLRNTELEEAQKERAKLENEREAYKERQATALVKIAEQHKRIEDELGTLVQQIAELRTDKNSKTKTLTDVQEDATEAQKELLQDIDEDTRKTWGDILLEATQSINNVHAEIAAVDARITQANSILEDKTKQLFESSKRKEQAENITNEELRSMDEKCVYYYYCTLRSARDSSFFV
jgi:chromosome segregation ATPase